MNIIFEDNDILIIDKPAGITVNKSDTTINDTTVQDWIEKREKKSNKNINKFDNELDFYKRAGIVHRIDKETSGILIIAKNIQSFINLQKQFKERSVKKKYIALVHGKILPEEGEIRVPIGRLPWNRKRFGVLAGGKEAVTKYEVNDSGKLLSSKGLNDFFSLLSLYPETGRTHQIRVHLKYINHPIFADGIYAGRKTSREDRKILPRLFLHASKITFFHPKTNKLISFNAPLPSQLENLIKK